MESFVVTDPGGNLTHGIVQFSTDTIANGTIINDGGTGSFAITGDFTLQNASPVFGIVDTSVNPQPATRFFTPPPTSTPPLADPLSISNVFSVHTSVTNPSAL